MMFVLDLYNVLKNSKKQVNGYNPKYNSYNYWQKNNNNNNNKLNAKLVSSMKYDFISFSDKYNDMIVKNNIQQKIKKLCIETIKKGGSENDNDNDNEKDNISMAIVKQSRVNAAICFVSILIVKYFFSRM